MPRTSVLARHAPFLVLIAFLFLAALYVEFYLDSFTYVLLNSRLLFQLFVGVTVIAVLKNVVGIQTFGTFAPAIVALAFLQAGLLIGTVLLLNILAIVIATREMIRRELVQQDHRVAIQLIMVGLTIVVLEVLA
ncbi:MAG: 7TM domain-containing protein, partial [Candidatus Thermoplasmatota archaeon]